jgi:hypothetical protein
MRSEAKVIMKLSPSPFLPSPPFSRVLSCHVTGPSESGSHDCCSHDDIDDAPKEAAEETWFRLRPV